MRLLLIEDDAALAAELRDALRARGFAVDHSADGVDGEFRGDEIEYDCVVLDLGLPGRPGLEVLRNWRARGNRMPVLVLTARDAWHERVDGLKAGADDYLGKPFHFEELAARIEALTRRSHGRAAPGVEAAGLKLDEERQMVTDRAGREIQLTATEFRLLRYFMLNPGVLLTKTRLTEHVYEEEADRDSNVIEVYVRRLREKLGADLIHTRRGQGYLFGEAP